MVDQLNGREGKLALPAYTEVETKTKSLIWIIWAEFSFVLHPFDGFLTFLCLKTKSRNNNNNKRKKQKDDDVNSCVHEMWSSVLQKHLSLLHPRFVLSVDKLKIKSNEMRIKWSDTLRLCSVESFVFFYRRLPVVNLFANWRKKTLLSHFAGGEKNGAILDLC